MTKIHESLVEVAVSWEFPMIDFKKAQSFAHFLSYVVVVLQHVSENLGDLEDYKMFNFLSVMSVVQPSTPR